MKVIVTGTTGYVGEGVMLALLDCPEVEKVLSITRRPCGHSHEKFSELVMPDLMDLREGDERLKGYDVVFFAAGITSVGTPKDVYEQISHTIPVHIASIMPDKDKTTFIYVSGAGTSERGRQHWQKVKSSTEREIRHMGFKHSFGWRPMLMVPYKGQITKQVSAQKKAMILYPLVRLLRQYNTMTEMARAIIAVTRDGYKRFAINPSDIIKLGR